MQDNTDHNRLAAQFAERLRADPDPAFVEQRVAAIKAFEARANGEAPRKPKRSTHVSPVQTTAAAPVATQGATSMFQPASNTTAYLKAAITGEPGAGKSMTAGLLAIGLIKYLKSLGIPGADKPVGFFDTERGSDWLIPLFKDSGIPLIVAKERSFAKMIEALGYMKENCSVGIFDSITHPWEDLKASQMKKKERSFLQIDEIVHLKTLWQRQFNDEYVNSPFHCVICGRAGDETEQWVDENGKRQFEKVGIKMRTEKDTAYESSLALLMERDQDLRTKQVSHFATVTKDRASVIDGKQFTFASYDKNGDRLPTDVLVRQVFVAFKPHIDQLNLGGPHMGVQVNGDSQHILKTERRDYTPVQREICIDEIQTLLQLHYPSQSAEDKKNKLKAILAHFDATWTEIEKVMPLPDLRAGYDSLHQALTGKPSKYGSAIAKDAQPNEINDSLPTFADLDDSESLPGLAAA